LASAFSGRTARAHAPPVARPARPMTTTSSSSTSPPSCTPRSSCANRRQRRCCRARSRCL